MATLSGKGMFQLLGEITYDHKIYPQIEKTHAVFPTVICAAIGILAWFTIRHAMDNSDFKLGLWNPERSVAQFGKDAGTGLLGGCPPEQCRKPLPI